MHGRTYRRTWDGLRRLEMLMMRMPFSGKYVFQHAWTSRRRFSIWQKSKDMLLRFTFTEVVVPKRERANIVGR